MTPEERVALTNKVLAAIDQEAEKYKDFEDSTRRIKKIRQTVEEAMKEDETNDKPGNSKTEEQTNGH